MPEEVFVVEGQATAGGHVVRNSRTCEDGIVQGEEPWAAAKSSAAGGGKGVLQSGNDLGHGQIDVAEARSDHPGRVRIEFEDAFEIAEKLR